MDMLSSTARGFPLDGCLLELNVLRLGKGKKPTATGFLRRRDCEAAVIPARRWRTSPTSFASIEVHVANRFSTCTGSP